MVADRAPDKLMHTTPSYPSPAAPRKASWNAPGEGAEVSGSMSLDLHRLQNSSAESSAPSTNSSDPKRIESGTTVTPRSSANDGVRSPALSVTTRTRALEYHIRLRLERTLPQGQ